MEEVYTLAIRALTNNGLILIIFPNKFEKIKFDFKNNEIHYYYYSGKIVCILIMLSSYTFMLLILLQFSYTFYAI